MANNPNNPGKAEAKAGDPKHPGSGKKPAESDFLTQQANDAAAAMATVVQDFKAKLGQGVDVEGWAKQYPWIALGGAAVAGFLGAYAMVPSREQSALGKLAKIEAALAPAQQHHPAAAPPPTSPLDSHANEYKPGKQSFFSSIAREVIGAIKPALISALSAGIGGAVAKPSEEDMENAANQEDQKQATGVRPPDNA
jgi:hypothetical protein